MQHRLETQKVSLLFNQPLHTEAGVDPKIKAGSFRIKSRKATEATPSEMNKRQTDALSSAGGGR